MQIFKLQLFNKHSESGEDEEERWDKQTVTLIEHITDFIKAYDISSSTGCLSTQHTCLLVDKTTL